MAGSTIFFLFVVLGLLGAVFALIMQAICTTPEQKEESRLWRKYGSLNKELICPHCRHKGQVRTTPVQQKKGVSGGKATGALLTGGASLLLVGLSRKEWNTQAHCMHCNSTWYF